jgi:hypothetical protein
MSVRKLNSIILGILPVIMIYKVPFTKFGFSTLMVAYLAFFSILVLHKNDWKLRLEFSLSIFFLYLIFRNIGNGLHPLFLILSFIVILGSRHDSFNISITLHTIEIVSLFISAIVIIQSLFHYALGFNLQTLYGSFILEEYSGIIGYSVTGGIFRPSGLFLEPAHFAQYVIIALLQNIRKNNLSVIKLIFLSIAMLCSTSGIGILLLISAYAYLLFTKTKELNWKRRLQYSVIFAVVLLIVVFTASKVPFIQMILKRVFSQDESGYNAIAGRSVHWEHTVQNLSGLQLFFGVGPKDFRIKGFITGLNEIIYYYGYVGLGLMIVSILDSMIKRFKEKSWYGILCIVYLGLIITSDVVGFIMLTFWFSLFASQNFKENC